MFPTQAQNSFQKLSLMDEIILANPEKNMSIFISNEFNQNSVSRKFTYNEPQFEFLSSNHPFQENYNIVASQFDNKSKNLNSSEIYTRSKVYINNPLSEVTTFFSEK